MGGGISHRIFRSRHCSGRPNFTTQLTTNLIIMPSSPIYYDFMDFILNTSTVRAASSIYGVHSRIIKNLLTNFEAHQHSRISREQKPLVKTMNHINITRWNQDRLYAQHGNKFYTEWDLMTKCVARVSINESYEEMKSKHGIPRSTMTIHLINICLSLQCRNTRKLQQRMMTREVSRSKPREVLQLSIKMNK